MQKSMPKKLWNLMQKGVKKYAKIDGNSLKINEKTRISDNLQNLDFCDTSAVKTWSCRYLEVKNPWKLIKNLCKIYARKSDAKMMQKSWKKEPKWS